MRHHWQGLSRAYQSTPGVRLKWQPGATQSAQYLSAQYLSESGSANCVTRSIAIAIRRGSIAALSLGIAAFNATATFLQFSHNFRLPTLTAAAASSGNLSPYRSNTLFAVPRGGGRRQGWRWGCICGGAMGDVGDAFSGSGDDALGRGQVPLAGWGREFFYFPPISPHFQPFGWSLALGVAAFWGLVGEILLIFPPIWRRFGGFWGGWRAGRYRFIMQDSRPLWRVWGSRARIRS